MKYHDIYFDRFNLCLTAGEARRGSHAGPCDDDIAALREDSDTDAMLSALYPEDVRAELTEYGAWDATELADHDANLSRILWIACCNLREELEAVNDE